MLGLRLDEPLPLAGLEPSARPRRARRGSSGSGLVARLERRRRSRSRPRGRFLGDGVTAELLACTNVQPATMGVQSSAERKRDILRRVVEEYVATRRAGRLEDARRARRRSTSRRRPFATSSPSSSGSGCSRIRTPPPGACRPRPATASTPTSCSRGWSRGPARFPLDLAAMRSEVEEALQATTEMLSQVTRLLALVSAPRARDGDRAARRGARRCSRRVVMVVVDHVDRRGREAALRVRPSPSTPGLVAWAGEYLNERLVGVRLGSHRCAAAFDEPSLTARERGVPATRSGRRSSTLAAPAGQRSSSAAPPACSTTSAPRRSAPTGSLIDALEKRAALLDVLASSFDAAPAVRPRRDELDHPALHDLALVGATYGLPTPDARRRSACSARCAWTTRRPSAPCAPPRTSSRASSRGVRRRLSAAATLCRMATTERDYYELLGVERGRRRAEIKKAFRRLARELHPDVSKEAGRRGALPRGRRGVRGALERRDAAALRPLRPRRPAPRRLHADPLRPRQPRRHLLRLLRRRPLRPARRAGAARGADVGAERDRARRGREGRRASVDVRGRGRRASTATATAPSRARAASAARRCGGSRPAAAGLAQRLRRVRAHADLRRVRRRRQRRRASCATCDGAGRGSSTQTLEVEIPPGIHDGQQIRLSRRGPRRRARRPAGDAYVEVRVAPDERFERDGNDIYTQVDLTIVQAALGATRRRPDARRPGRARVRARHAAGRRARAARQGHAGAAALRPRRPARARERQRAAAPDRRAAQAARAVRRAVRRGHLPPRRGLLREAQRTHSADAPAARLGQRPARQGRAGAGASCSSSSRTVSRSSRPRTSSSSRRTRTPRVRSALWQAFGGAAVRGGRGLGGALAPVPPAGPRRRRSGSGRRGRRRRRRDRRRDRSGPRLRHRRASRPRSSACSCCSAPSVAASSTSAAARACSRSPRRSSASTRSSPSTSTRRPSRRPAQRPARTTSSIDIRLADLREERLPRGRRRRREHRSRVGRRARRQAGRAARDHLRLSRLGRPRAGRLPARGTAVRGRLGGRSARPRLTL